METPTRTEERWKFLIATNKVGVAKRLTIRSETGRTRKLADATTLKASKAWRDILRRDPCAYCGGTGGTIDHITPRALGGAKDSLRNWTGACLQCNLKRGPRGLIYFLAGAEDPMPGERAKAIKKIRAAWSHDIGPEIRKALDGVPGKTARRQIADAIVKRHRARYADRKQLWQQLKDNLHLELVGEGHASSDDPTAIQHRRTTRFGKLNDPATETPARNP